MEPRVAAAVILGVMFKIPCSSSGGGGAGSKAGPAHLSGSLLLWRKGSAGERWVLPGRCSGSIGQSRCLPPPSPAADSTPPPREGLPPALGPISATCCCAVSGTSLTRSEFCLLRCKGRNKTKGCRIRPAPKPSGSESPERLGGERPSERSARGWGLPTPSLV